MRSVYGSFQENYSQDMAVFRTGLHWGLVVALLVFLLTCPLFLSDRMLTMLTLIGSCGERAPPCLFRVMSVVLTLPSRESRPQLRIMTEIPCLDSSRTGRR